MTTKSCGSPWFLSILLGLLAASGVGQASGACAGVAEAQSSRCRVAAIVGEHATSKRFIATPLVEVDRPRPNAGDVPFTVDIWLIERRDVAQNEWWLERYVSRDWQPGAGVKKQVPGFEPPLNPVEIAERIGGQRLPD